MPILKSIDSFLKKIGTTLVYQGTSDLTLQVPEFFKEREFLQIENEVSLLAICKLTVNSYERTLIFPTIIHTQPFDVKLKDDYYNLIYKKDNLFITNTNIVKDSSLLYRLFTTFITLGKIPDYVDYENLPYIFDFAQNLSGASLNSRRCIFELLFGHLARDKEDLFKMYRNTKMDKNYKLISMNDIPHVTSSASSKLLGSYYRDGITSATLTESSESEASPIETLLKA